MRVKVGDIARVIGGVDCNANNMGQIVEVCSFQGQHTQYGAIWRCRSQQPLISEYGAVGNFMDFADDWLEPIIDPIPLESDKLVLEKVA